ncbi:MAG: D-aminoacylase [Acholeplasmataceae bacterium]|nr:D-aminoacylase [Acholeplasmataceae bacterium]
MKLMIKNGMIVDGTGRQGYLGNIVVDDGLITEIGNINPQVFDKEIDANGLVVAPGFIDTHSHSDLEILVKQHIEPKIRQGVTTEILGQDGISMAPLPLEYISSWRKNLAGLDGDSEEIDWTYQNTDGYLSLLQNKGVSLNEAYLVPHGNIRMEAMGLDSRKPKSLEMQKMCDILRRELDAGAYGLSTGLIYPPCAYADTEELVELCKVVAEYDGVFVVHQRSEADTIIPSMQEVLEIGRRSGAKIHFSHFKVCGHKNRRFIKEMTELLDKGQEEGLRISFDQYPYVAGSTMLGVILPPWAHDGGTDKLLERLEDAELRKKMIFDIEHGLPGWDNFVEFAGLDKIFVTSVKTTKNADLVGKNLVEIGKLQGKDPYEAVFDLLYQEENAVGMVDFYGAEEDVKLFLTRKEQNVCTDGLLAGKPHPRVFGAFPRVLGKYVREEKTLSLEEAVKKMTSKPAEVFGIQGRGVLKAGNYADIVIFDPQTVIDMGTFIEPEQYPRGIEYVVINGSVVLQSGQYGKKVAGKVLRKAKNG